MSDPRTPSLVERLEKLAEHFAQSAAERAKVEGFAASAGYWAENAADLRALLALLRKAAEAMEPFAEAVRYANQKVGPRPGQLSGEIWLEVAHGEVGVLPFRRLAAVLEELK